MLLFNRVADRGEACSFTGEDAVTDTLFEFFQWVGTRPGASVNVSVCT